MANANETLEELFHEFNLAGYGKFDIPTFQEAFHTINQGLWHQYHQGQVDQLYIRKERFKRVMESLKIQDFQHSEIMGAQYLSACPRKGYLMPYAIETLEYLQARYPMSIITNGFDEIQDVKMSTSGLTKYFNSVVTSEKAGSLKPHKEIFDFAMKKAAANATECLMIGDNPVTDIGGAINSGIDQVYYNSRSCQDQMQPTFTIEQLIDLKKLL